MRLRFYLFGALVTILGALALKLSDKLDAGYISATNKLSPVEWQIRDKRKFKKYLKFRKAFLLLSGLGIVALSMFLP